LKKHISARQGINKSELDYEINNSFHNNEEETSLENGAKTMQQQPMLVQQQPMLVQQNLYQDIINLSQQELSNKQNAKYIYANQLPLIHKEGFFPSSKQAFPQYGNITYKNTFTPSKYMLYHYDNTGGLSNSFIFVFIYNMVKQNMNEFMKVILWLTSCFPTLEKQQYVFVMYSESDIYMKLFYEEIVAPLFNPDFCEVIENDSLDKKSLSTKLNEKVIYNFQDITENIILDSKASDLVGRLLYKDDYKVNNKTITAAANILITSTSKYIPLLSNEIQSDIVSVDSSLDSLYQEHNIPKGKYHIASMIEKDLGNFSNILRNLDLNRLRQFQNNSNYEFIGIMDNDVQPIEVFHRCIIDKDITLFKSLAPELKDRLVDDFQKDRVNRKFLVEYFSKVFGTGIYKTTRAIVKALKKVSYTELPFNNDKTFNNNGNVYYKLARRRRKR
jgi:hypothetical protein